MKISRLLDKLAHCEKAVQYRKLKKLITPGFTEEQEAEFKSAFSKEATSVFTYVNTTEAELISKSNAVDGEQAECLKSELFDFTEFIRVNLLAFKRILKRHDKYTGYSAMGDYKDVLKEKTRQLEALQELMATLGSCRNEALAGKFWVPTDELADLKLQLTERLPQQSFVGESEILEDSVVSSIYFDNTDFALYTGLLEEQEAAFSFRLRWFGRKCDRVHCELHGQSGTVALTLLHKHVLGFINGDDIWSSLREVDPANSREDYDVIRDQLRKFRLRPTVRTFFRRIQFKSEKVTVSLDSNVVMVRECSNFDLSQDSFPLRSFARSDVGYDWPFRSLAPTEIARFPCSVLTIHAKGDPDTVEWLEGLLSGSRIEKVPGFSKFVHGTALLYTGTALQPAWIAKSVDLAHEETPEAVDRSRFSRRILSISGDSDVAYNFTPIADPAHPIAIPIRIEPKVFFANERTFLSWIQFAVFLGGIGTALIGLGNPQAFLCGVMLISVALVFSLYAFYLFYYRAVRIRTKDPSPYEDILGPTILTGFFILSMVLSFVFKFPIKKNGLR